MRPFLIKVAIKILAWIFRVDLFDLKVSESRSACRCLRVRYVENGEPVSYEVPNPTCPIHKGEGS